MELYNLNVWQNFFNCIIITILIKQNFLFNSVNLTANSFLPIFAPKYYRDDKGRFSKIIHNPNQDPLPDNIIYPLVGNMLGDGHLRFTHKDKTGKPKQNTNASHAMTLKSHEYIMHLRDKIYFQISTPTLPKP